MNTKHIARLKVNSILAFRIVVATTAIYSTGAAAEKPSASQTGQKPVRVQEMIDARTDVWGDAAMRQPNGASYEFFKDLLPPVRWVNAEFRHYPIVLSAPRAPQKVRLISNGSAINARGNMPRAWYDQGVPVKFFVGDPAEGFGADVSRLETPAYADGYLPVVTIRYKSGEASYQEECFAPVGEKLSALGTVMIRFSIDGASKSGRVEARIDSPTVHVQGGGRVFDGKDNVLVSYDRKWSWDADRKALVANLQANQTAELAIFTKWAEVNDLITSAIYDEEKNQCIRKWKDILERGVGLETPESIVNDAWRALVVGNLMTAVNELPHYSAQNQYGPSPGSPRHLYEAECGDTVRSLLLFGQLELGPPMLKPMLEFPRKDTRFHVAGQKLQLLAYFYWLTRDTETVRRYEPLWRQAEELILKSRESDTGLLPRDNYAGDIHAQVLSLNSNSNCWRGLRDLAAVLDDMGEKDEAARIREEAGTYRKAILTAADRSIRRDAKPPYIPIALMADEKAPDPLTATELGSYYDLICPYIICSEIFGQGSQQEDWLFGYLQNHGGITMGMMRTERHGGANNGSKGIAPLYALRYNLALLRRDEREKALVAFYGHLAQAMTRGTFIGGEGNRFTFHGDANGREFVLPPNSTSNATWLLMLRYLLVQDWDLNEDGKPDTLRLMYGVPRQWLADGKKIRFKEAPTAFGPVSLAAESNLSQGAVEVEVKLPPREVKSISLRVPLPMGWRADSVEVDGKPEKIIGGNSVDLSGRKENVRVQFRVKADSGPQSTSRGRRSPIY